VGIGRWEKTGAVCKGDGISGLVCTGKPPATIDQVKRKERDVEEQKHRRKVSDHGREI